MSLVELLRISPKPTCALLEDVDWSLMTSKVRGTPFLAADVPDLLQTPGSSQMDAGVHQ